jgi:hypothetical protein
MQPPTSSGDADSDDPVPALGTVALVSGIVEDARDLVGAHVEALRDDISERVTALGATLAWTLIAIGVFVVTAILLCLAVAASLVAIGTPWWLALWSVTVAAGAIGVGFVLRARRPRTGEQGIVATARTRSEVAEVAIEQPPA